MIKLNVARLALMAVYLMGVGVFLYAGQFIDAILLTAVIYWTNVAWFKDGMLRVAHILLKEAHDIMQDQIKNKEPVSDKEEA